MSADLSGRPFGQPATQQSPSLASRLGPTGECQAQGHGHAYRSGLDENGQWEASEGNLALTKHGAIVDLGQVPGWMAKQLNALTKGGALVKYRGHWDTLLTFAGMGPRKTIWALPEIAKAAGAEQVPA